MRKDYVVEAKKATLVEKPEEIQRWLLLRGLTREKGHWGSFLRQFEQRFSHAEVRAIDLPGCGQHFKELSPCSIPGIAASLLKHAPLKDWRKDDKAFGIFGLSMGGLVAMELAQQMKSCKRVVLVNSSLTSLSPPWHRLRPSALFTLLSVLGRWYHAERENAILRLTSQNFSTHLKTQAEWRQIHLQRPVSRLSAIAQLIAAAYYVPRQKHLNGVKTLVLSGGKDRIVNPQSSQRLARWLNSSLVIQPNAGHDLPLDDPAWVCTQVAEWMRRS